MRKNHLIPFLLMGICSSFVAVNSAYATAFMPYVDITLNTRWDSQYQDMEPADWDTVSRESKVNHLRLAFITDAGHCEPAWGAQSTYAISAKWGSHLTDQLRQDKIQYDISFGGASGNDVSMNCSDNELLASFVNVFKTYQPSGLDFDIENGTADINKTMRALSALQKNYPTLPLSFTLPVMPEGLTASGKDIINLAHQYQLNFHVNIMAMDYGPAYNGDMAEYAKLAAKNLHDFLRTLYSEKSDEAIWNMIEVTPMIGVNDVNVEKFTLQNADALNEFAKQNKLGGLSMWSLSRDNPCSDVWASPVCSGGNLQTVKYEFAKHMMGI